MGTTEDGTSKRNLTKRLSWKECDEVQRRGSSEEVQRSGSRASGISRRGSVLEDIPNSVRSLIDGEVSVREIMDTFEGRKSQRMSTRSMTTLGSAEEEAAKQRRKEKEIPSSKLDTFDEAIDWFITRFLEEPMEERCCSVSEKAKKSGNEDDAHVGEATDESALAHIEFGFHHIDASGYVVEDNTTWLDPRLSKLGLHRATHAHSSIEKICYIKQKSDFPPWISKERVLKELKHLLSCQHVNILHLQEIFEDDFAVYLLFEDFPCVTLGSVLDSNEWTQEQIANMARECCAAMAYAHGIGTYHLGLSLSHVLLTKDWHRNPKIAKMFGFGFMGIVSVETERRELWAPELLDLYNRFGESFVTKIETSQRAAADLWSLGAIVYALIARRPPENEGFKWTFPTAFDAVDPEVKAIVEGLLKKDPSERMKPKQALLAPWIRKYWKPRHARKIFRKLEVFCHATLPTRLFGRFVVRFLNAEQMQKVALDFYELDAQGDGIICQGDLLNACKTYADTPNASYRQMSSCLFDGESKTVNLSRFAECMAEEVIDGPALRHAFESLDDDGSQCISPEELFAALRELDEALTLEEVVLHIETTEQNVGGDGEDKKDEEGGGGSDGTIDFNEFVRLFPTRVARVKALEDRIEGSQRSANELRNRLVTVKAKLRKWVKTLEDEKEDIDKLLFDRQVTSEQRLPALKHRFKMVASLFGHPPGPATAEEHNANFKSYMRNRKNKNGKKAQGDVFGYDSFAQDQSHNSFWSILIEEDRKKLKGAVIKESSTEVHIDPFAVHDAGESVANKISEVVDWTKAQLEEYESFAEVQTDLELRLPQIPYSARGLMLQNSENAKEDAEQDEDAAARRGSCFARILNLR